MPKRGQLDIGSSPGVEEPGGKKQRENHDRDEEMLLSAFSDFPRVQDEYRKLIRQGWRIEIGLEVGTGTACIPSRSTINIDPVLFDDENHSKVLVTIGFVHEGVGHANFNLPQKLQNMGTSPSRQDYIQLSADDEGNSALEEFKLLGDAEGITDLYAQVELTLQDKYGEKFKDCLKIYEQWKVDSLTDKDRVTAAAREALGKIYAFLQPSATPDGVTYHDEWDMQFNHQYGEQKMEKLIKELNSNSIHVIDEDGEGAVPSHGNIEQIFRIQIDNVPNENGMIVFLPRATMESVDAAYDSELTMAVVSNALLYVKPRIRTEQDENGFPYWRAVHNFTQDARAYKVEYGFDETGQIENMTLEGVSRF